MNQIFRRFRQIPLFVRVALTGSGFAALLSLALAAPNLAPEKPAAPPPPVERPLPQPESHPVAGPLKLVSLAAGPQPWVNAPGRQVVRTFISDDTEMLRVVAAARLRPGLDPDSIRWTVSAPRGFVVPVEGKWTGTRLDVTLRRPGGNPSGLGGPLALTVQARVSVDGEQHAVQETVVQDEVDQLRQEYVDLARRAVPARGEFLNAAAFAERYGQKYPWLRFEHLNWSVNPTTGERFSRAIIRPELVAGLDRMRRAYGSITINSGYRNPTRQVEVHAPVRESLHQYGYAADLAVTPGAGRSWPNEADWRQLAEVACGARAKWVEPLTSSSPNGPGCHVHVDYRPGPASSAPVSLRGQVLAAATGQPVAGALVLLGGMPARTDANGFFVVRNVLSGGSYPVEVRAEGYEPLVHPVRLKAWGTASTRLSLQPPAREGVTVTVARTSWLDEAAGLLALGLQVRNAGPTAAEVRLGIGSTGARVSPASTRLAVLPAGAARQVALNVRLPRGKDPAPFSLAVDLAFRLAAGKEERARVQLLAPLPEPAPKPPSTASAPERPPLKQGAPVPVPRPAAAPAEESPAVLKPAPAVAEPPSAPPRPVGPEPEPAPPATTDTAPPERQPAAPAPPAAAGESESGSATEESEPSPSADEGDPSAEED